MTKKNLLIITCDQLGGDWYDIDKKLVDTPWLAKITQKSWISKRCYTSSPHCMPARFSWITGIAPSMLGITSNMRVRLNKRAPSILRKLREKGIETAIIGKTHWTSHTQEGDLREDEDLINSLGFNKVIEIAGPKGLRKKTCKITDDWKAYGCYDTIMEDMEARYKKGRSKDAWKVRPTVAPNKLYPDIWIKTEAIKVLEELKKSRKDWCVWVSFVGPHEPFDTPEPWKGLHKNHRRIKIANKDKWIKRQENESEIKKTYRSWEGKVSKNEIEEIINDYADHIKLIDDQIGELYQWLEKNQSLNNTAIVITSDHGEMLGDGGMLYKGTLLDSAIKVPFIYKPISSTNIDTKMVCSRPIGLTQALKTTVKFYRSKNSIERMIRWANRTGGAISEYKNERAYIKGNYKLVLNKNGEIIWATKPEKNNEEITYTEDAIDKKGNWSRIVTWALKKHHKRESRKNTKKIYIEVD